MELAHELISFLVVRSFIWRLSGIILLIIAVVSGYPESRGSLEDGDLK